MSRAIAAMGIAPSSLQISELSTEDLRGELAEKKILHARTFRRPQRQQRPAQHDQDRLEENYLYSSRRFPSLSTNTIAGGLLTAGSFPLFNRGIGEDGSGLGWPTGFTLSQAETNLEVGGYLPQGSNFVGTQLLVTANSDVGTADLAQLLDAVTLTFSKAGGQFSMLHGPIKAWPGGMGVGGYVSTTAATTTITGAHNGAADIRAVRSLRIPRVLKEKEVFNYSLVLSRTSRATDGVAIALTNFVVLTIWLFGGAKNAVSA
jgi:hypothetical protein